MLRALALMPDSPMLLPGVTGRTDPAGAARAAALDAVASAARAVPTDGGVVALATGPLFDSGWRDPLEFAVSLAALGVPDEALPAAIAEGASGRENPQFVPIPLAPAVYAIEQAGWRGAVRYVLIPPDLVWAASLDLSLSLTGTRPSAVICCGVAPATGPGPWQLAAASARLNSEWLPVMTLHSLPASKLAAEAKGWGDALRWQGKIGGMWSTSAVWVAP